MKLRGWEIRNHLVDLLGEEHDVFGSDFDFTVRVWRVRPGFAILQHGDQIAINIDGLSGKYFEPDLVKINSASIILADRIAGATHYNTEYGSPDLVERLFSR